jgi:hypothetical protein
VAEAPPAAEGGSPLKAITRKVGPLPVWAYAAILVIGYVLYKRMKGGSSSTTAAAPATGASPTDQTTYVPGFDAAGAGGGGGIGATGVPSTVNNYYYGDQGSGQASGGGTSSGTPVTNPISTPGGGGSGGPISTVPISYPGGGVFKPPVTQPFGPEPIPYRGRLGPAIPY